MNCLIAWISWLDRQIERAEVLILITSVAAMALNSITNVLGRYVFSQGLYFSEELNQFLMIATTFIGLSYITRQGRHIRMSALYDALNPTSKRRLMMLISLMTATVMFILAYYAWEYLAKLANRGKVTPALRLPVYLTLAFIPVGFALTGTQYLLTFFRNLTRQQVYIAYNCLDGYDTQEEKSPAVDDSEKSPSTRFRRSGS